MTKLPELTAAFPAAMLLPEWDSDAAVAEQGWLVLDAMDAARENATISVHSWLVRTKWHTVLIDADVGNGKTSAIAHFDHRATPWLEQLESSGVTPESVTHVLLAHIHADHVGRNTRLVDGRWVPTFSNAHTFVLRLGLEFFSRPEGRARPNYDMVADSVLPVVEAGRAELVEREGGEVLEGFFYHATPGHSVDHMSISFRSGGEEAFFAGDVMHHPIQLRRPGWSSVFCADPERATASRRWALEHAAEQGALYCSTHFPGMSAGRVTRAGDAFRWESVQSGA